MRIAFFTPLSPLQTALADHSEGLLPHLAQGADIDLFIDEGYQPVNAEIVSRFRIFPFKEFAGRSTEYDLTVYVMGNNLDFHGYMYDFLQQYPGVVVLHDTEFQHYFSTRSSMSRDLAGYCDLMTAVYGEVGRRAAVASLAGRYAAVRKSFLLVEPILDCSLGAVVYNQFSQQDLLARRPHADIRCLRYHFYLPGGFPEQVDVQALRQRWRVDSRFVIGTFGLFTTADKRIDVCLRVFKRFLDFMPDARYLLVGSYSAQYDVPAMVRAYGLEERVVVTGWMDALQFAQHLCVPDIAIHLRYPHIGGTLYTPIRLLGLGIPTILSDIGPLQEFPEGCCAKILPDEYEEETLLKTLCYLAERNDFRQQMGENGRQFIQQHHNVNQVACEHLDFFRQVASSPVGTTRAQMPGVWEGHLIRQCAGALARWGVEETEDMMLTPIAEAIARTVREKPSCGVL